MMLDRDPKELLELARKFDRYPPDPQTYANLRPFFKSWAQIDADAAFAGAKAIKDLLCREVATMEIAQAARPEGAGRVARLILGQPDGTYREQMRDKLLDTAIENWSQSNPFSAMEAFGG